MLWRQKLSFKHDIHILWHEERRYYLDLAWDSNELFVHARVWDREVPLAIGKAPRGMLLDLWRGEHEEVMMSFLKRVAEADSAKRQQASKVAATWLSQFPALGEYLTMTKYPDGGQRQTATVLIFCEEGQWKGCLRDRDTSRTLWVTSGSPPEVLSDLEAALQSDTAEWRKEKPFNNGQKKGK